MEKIKIINSIEELVKLKETWEELYTQNSDQNPFISFDWILNAVKFYCENKQLSVFLINNDTSIIGIAPFWIEIKKIRGIRLKALSFIITPDSTHTGFLIKNTFEREFFSSLLKEVKGSKNCDMLFLDHLPDDHPHYRQLIEALEKEKFKYFSEISSHVPVVIINEDWDTFFKSLAKGFRRSRRNINNRINKFDHVEMISSNSENQEKTFTDMVEVTKKGWKYQDGIALSNKDSAVSFFKNVSNNTINSFESFTWILYLDNKPVAMEFNLIKNKKVYALRADYDEEYRDSSPGAYLENHILKYYFDNNYQEYSTGLGTSGYKMHWANHTRINMGIRISCDSLKGNLIWTLITKVIEPLKSVKNVISK